jgi:hypothetical protein
MKRFIAAGSIGLLALVTGTVGAATLPAQQRVAPGTYRQINTVTKQALVEGSQLVIVPGKAGRLGFSLNAVRQSDTNQGYAVGTLSGVLPATWTKTADSGNCKLTFEAVPNVGLKVTQDMGFGDCGFGSGVSANGTYQLVAEKPPKT